MKHVLTTVMPKYLPDEPAVWDEARARRGPRHARPHRDEERRLLAVLGPEEKALVIGAMDTLLRLRDIADLTRRQDHGTYLHTDTKTGAVKVPISTRLRKALDALPKGGPHYFPTYGGHSNNLVIRMFREGCEKAEVQTGRKTGGVSFHCLRHTGASRMLAAGVDVKTAMEIGGWKNLKVMERYLHPTSEAKQQAVNAIGRRRR